MRIAISALIAGVGLLGSGIAAAQQTKVVQGGRDWAVEQVDGKCQLVASIRGSSKLRQVRLHLDLSSDYPSQMSLLATGSDPVQAMRTNLKTGETNGDVLLLPFDNHDGQVGWTLPDLLEQGISWQLGGDTPIQIGLGGEVLVLFTSGVAGLAGEIAGCESDMLRQLGVDAPSLVPPAKKAYPKKGVVVGPQDYPQPALYNEWQGTVGIAVLVSANGRANACVISKSSNYAVLDEAACKGASRSRYVPAQDEEGKPIDGLYRTWVTFSLPN